MLFPISSSSSKMLRYAFVSTLASSSNPVLTSRTKTSTIRPTNVSLWTSVFTGRKTCASIRGRAAHCNKAKSARPTTPSMMVDPWSVSPEAIDQLAVQFLGFLFLISPFLFFLSRKETDCPPVANFGFRFLLVFVFATIPAGIYAKQAYGTILANVDWLHGTAESFLTITNLIIVIGFRQALKRLRSENSTDTMTDDSNSSVTASIEQQKLQTPVLVTMSIIAAVIANTTGTLSFLHSEPANALSLPTWIVHASSLLEWLAAMGLVWEYAEVTGRQKWKGLVWGMLPLHTSGICACTYHVFYNAPAVNGIVALQAALTCFGNATMAFATWRVFNGALSKSTSSEDSELNLKNAMMKSTQAQKSSDPIYYTRLAVGTVLLSAAVKWGSLAVDFPFQPSYNTAGVIVALPTAINMIKWAVRSKTGKELFGGLFVDTPSYFINIVFPFPIYLRE